MSVRRPRPPAHSASAAVACSLLAALGACAPAAPRATTPEQALAQAVAPEAVRPELAEVLSAMLRRGQGDFVLPLGNDHIRCRLGRTDAGAEIDCEGDTAHDTSVLALVRRVHRGEVTSHVVMSRLADDARFMTHTGLWAGEAVERGEGWIERRLGDPLGVVRFEVLDAGERVRARHEGVDDFEEIEARSMAELGRRLRERADALPGERTQSRFSRDLREGFSQTLGWLKQEEGGWSLAGMKLGSPQAEQPQLAGASTGASDATGPRWAGRHRVGTVRMQFSNQLGQFETFDGRVVRLSVSGLWMRLQPEGTTLDCGDLSAWLRSKGSALAPAPPTAAEHCRWEMRAGAVRMEVTLQAPGRYTIDLRLDDPAMEAFQEQTRRLDEAAEQAALEKELAQSATTRCLECGQGRCPPCKSFSVGRRTVNVSQKSDVVSVLSPLCGVLMRPVASPDAPAASLQMLPCDRGKL